MNQKKLRRLYEEERMAASAGAAASNVRYDLVPRTDLQQYGRHFEG